MSVRSVELNLFPKEPWERGAIGQLLTWVLSVGRYVVVFTEAIVISAFLYRFGLDRSLTDLRASVKNKQAQVTSFGDLESSFRLIQAKLDLVKSVTDQPRVATALTILGKMMPTDAVLTNVTINQKQVVIEGVVASQTGLATLLSQAQAKTEFNDVVLENVKSAADKNSGIEFRLTLTFKTI